MKFILPRNLLFDTATATTVGYWSNGKHYSDPDFEEELLYRAPRGGFFLVGNRLQATASSEAGSNTCELITPEEALRWCIARGQESAAAEHLKNVLTFA